MIKTTKITAGYYKGCYKNINFFICKVSDLPNNEIAWYWQIGEQNVNDWYGSKWVAIRALKAYIDENI